MKKVMKKNNVIPNVDLISRINYENTTFLYKKYFNSRLKFAGIMDFGSEKACLNFSYSKKIYSLGLFGSEIPNRSNAAIYVEQSNVNIKIINHDSNYFYLPRLIFCLGSGNHNIEYNSWRDNGLRALSVMVDSQGHDFTLRLIEKGTRFLGNITKDNMVLNITEDTLLMKDGTVFNETFFQAMINQCETLDSLDTAIAFLEKAKNEVDELHKKFKDNNITISHDTYSVTSYVSPIIKWFFKLFDDLIEEKIKELKLDTVVLSKLDNKNNIQTQFSNDMGSNIDIKTEDKSKYYEIISSFREYQNDLVKMMKHPVLSDLTDTRVNDFNLLCIKFENKEIDLTLSDLLNQWNTLINYAKTKNTSHLTDEQSKKLVDSKTLMSKALNEESTDNEKDLSIKALERNLNGVLPIDNQIIDSFKQQVGLKELL